MATITKRGETYRIRTSCGYDVNGKQVMRSMTYKPLPGMSEKQIDKEVNRQAVLFEENCRQGQLLTASKFEAFAREWFKNYAELTLKKLTLCSYHRMEKRAYDAFGHLRIDRITPNDIQKFIRSLVADGLAPSTVRNYVRFVSTILNYAIKKRIIQYNPCVTADYPKLVEKEPEMYSIEEINQMLGLLCREKYEDMPYAVYFILAAYTGCRRGEILGFEWKDIDFANGGVSISRASYYDSVECEQFTDTPKSLTSNRTLKLPANVMQFLAEYREWQADQREFAGGSWVETDRLFTKWNGEPMSYQAPEYWLKVFCEATGMRKLKIHSFRHFYASLLIHNGVDVVTVQNALGHSQPSTSLNIYSHAFKTAQTRTMDVLTASIGF